MCLMGRKEGRKFLVWGSGPAGGEEGFFKKKFVGEGGREGGDIGKCVRACSAIGGLGGEGDLCFCIVLYCIVLSINIKLN